MYGLPSTQVHKGDQVMMLRGDGWEVSVREVGLAGTAEYWRPVVFFMGVLTNQGVALQVWYLNNEGQLAVATNNKLRQVGT